MSEKSSSLSSLALQKFKRNFWGVLSLGYIIICGIIAIFAYVFAPDNSQNANQMHLSIHSKPPGFEVNLLSIPSENISEQSVINKLFFGKKNLDTEIPISSYFIENDQLIYTSYSEIGKTTIQKSVSITKLKGSGNTKDIINTKTFYLGTDKYGRDLLSRVLIGTRISFFIGFIAVFISLVIGIFTGALAGYYGGKIDAFIMWIINISWSIPTLLLVIAITLALGKGFW